MATLFSSDNVVHIFAVVATYWTISISMVYLNKVLMSNNDFSVAAPLFVTWYQCVITSLICWLAGLCGGRSQHSRGYSILSSTELSDINTAPKPSFFAQFPKASYKIGVAIKIFPLSCVFLAMITFNNLCLKYVEVSFYNVARSLTIVFNVFLSWVLIGVQPSKKTFACLFVVVFGFFVGTEGEGNFSMFGTSCGVLSSLFVSLNSIFTKQVLSAVEDNHWRLTWYNNINATIIFIPLIYYFEVDFIQEQKEKLENKEFWIALTLAGCFGFAIGIVTVLQIKATSPLGHNISGTAKAAFQSMMAFHIWGNEASFMGITGIFVVLGGSLLYTYLKMKEHSPSRFPPPQQEQVVYTELVKNEGNELT